MLIYSMHLYIAAQLEYLLRKTKDKKKIPIKCYREMQLLYIYLKEQIILVPQYFNSNHYHKFIERLWTTILKSMDELVVEDLELSIPQICIMADFLEFAERRLSQVSTPNLTEQRKELMKKFLLHTNEKDFNTYKSEVFQIEKEEYLKKEPTLNIRTVTTEGSEPSSTRSTQSSNPSSPLAHSHHDDSSDDWLLNSDDYPKISARYIHKDESSSETDNEVKEIKESTETEGSDVQYMSTVPEDTSSSTKEKRNRTNSVGEGNKNAVNSLKSQSQEKEKPEVQKITRSLSDTKLKLMEVDPPAKVLVPERRRKNNDKTSKSLYPSRSQPMERIRPISTRDYPQRELLSKSERNRLKSEQLSQREHKKDSTPTTPDRKPHPPSQNDPQDRHKEFSVIRVSRMTKQKSLNNK
eukprot:TRINITY_DN6458_c0_g2_i1.p1 TRINITY_DN6458_c0_g2~~TRINITY_DN6458_c0_g2_i1.p1  ORF type:complete len:417 (+),score=107.82 TRINITY_DN6458_c0_g2_i1:27-1253(+)